MGSSVESDVLIVGGGLAGSLLANALLQIPLRVALIEAREPRRLEQPSFDGRATALANGSQRVLKQLGLWEPLKVSAQAIEHIHISERGRFGAARIDAQREHVDALGYTVENRALGEAFWSPLEHRAEFHCLAPATLASFECEDGFVRAQVNDEGRVVNLRGRCLVAADGTRSSVRSALGIATREDDYAQKAIVVNCATELPHRARAFERFTPQGPLAVLPLTRDRVAVVWTLPANAADATMALPDDAFRAALQQAFGMRLGRLQRVGVRACHPLVRLRSDELTQDRIVLIGNAAVSLHPVAGQGFNLAIRDIATLAEVFADEVAAHGARADVGSAAVLERYRQWRASDQRKLAWFTHGLVQCFGIRAPGAGALRGLGLMAFDLLPGAKSLLARHTMGMAGTLPRLARGLSLS